MQSDTAFPKDKNLSFRQLSFQEGVSCLTTNSNQTDLSTKVKNQEQKAILIEWHLPGWSDSYDDCGQFFGWVACPRGCRDSTYLDDKGKIGHHVKRRVKKSCHRAECPTCYEDWARRGAERVSERILGAIPLYKAVGINLGKVKHVIFSPPQDWANKLMQTEEGYKKLRGEALKVMKEAGAIGGCPIFHSHRRDFICRSCGNRFKQDWGDEFRKARCPECGSGASYGDWYLSPHFHYVGFGYLRDSDVFHGDTGWIYCNLGKRKTVFGTVFYLLTHCGLGYRLGGDRRLYKSILWFGFLHHSRMRISACGKWNVVLKCGCGCDLYRYGGGDDAIDWGDCKGVAFVRKEVRSFELVWRKIRPDDGKDDYG